MAHFMSFIYAAVVSDIRLPGGHAWPGPSEDTAALCEEIEAAGGRRPSIGAGKNPNPLNFVPVECYHSKSSGL